MKMTDAEVIELGENFSTGYTDEEIEYGLFKREFYASHPKEAYRYFEVLEEFPARGY